MCKIAIILSVFNGERYLSKAIESILNQTYKDFVFFIVDDASTDGSFDILKYYVAKDDRIHLYENSYNKGISVSLNFMLHTLSVKYVNIIDQDDISHPQKLEKTFDFLESNPEYGLVGTKYSIINEDGRVIDELDWMLESDEDIRKDLYFQNWFGHGSILFRLNAIRDAGYYDKQFDQAQDYDLILRVAETWKIANLPEKLWYWRKWAGNTGDPEVQKKLHKMLKYKQYCRQMGIIFDREHFERRLKQ